ncbi:chromosome segregation protein SMC [Urbifossiella limnaea]|uniref:Chromosome partition protein Smc n=1 Tax=Urbifossiella limnaea TaxID=2528023 RepID=A0A517XL16_9BACT|nr:chromosome segregation protein SMC [Urbifossiella limnaea]QDU18194.1 Chromosome partition protein Smc [Urbifossiella limnaea]
MLSRLELVGFKSFADKTRLDFSPGVTAVVGPNGSGKSNVVDAVRWILGEQSAKSLRGGEMADVIFNGSSSRKSLGMAEVTVTFDNARRLLGVDADEVQVTRRVYRDGTGEYLINGMMSRLKDIKDIFLGTGAGSGGYTIIAQGRVDELLQASTKDRREIFDEAAGISRFKAKKNEALRKLVAVESNLTRSRDRLDGLDAQLRTLRMQASKAQKYKEYSDRLKELRVGLGAKEYRDLSAALAAEEAALAELTAAAGGSAARAEELDRTARALDAAVTATEAELRREEAALADARQRIAGFEAGAKHDRAAAAEHEAEVARVAKARADIAARLRGIEAELATAASAAQAADAAFVAETHTAEAATAALAAATSHAADVTARITAGQERQFDLVRRATAARGRTTASLEQVERLQAGYTRKRGELGHLGARRGGLETALDGLSRADADVQARLADARDSLDRLHSERDALDHAQETVQGRLEALRVRQGDLRGRVEVLEGLERAQEGLGAGVRAVLDLLRTGTRTLPTPLPLVADLLTVPREVAGLVELALGDAAQRFVVRDPGAVDAVVAAVTGVPGRVGFIPLAPPNPPADADGSPLTLASFVRCEHPDFAALPDQLLGAVVLADTLADARRHPGRRVITRAGDLLEPDGTLTVGPVVGGAGLVSRKSELRDLRDQSRALAADVTAAEAELADLRRDADAVAGRAEAAEAEIDLLSGEAGDLQQRIAVQRQQLDELDDRIELLRAEARTDEEEVRRAEAAWVGAKLEAEAAEAEAAGLETELERLKSEAKAAAEAQAAAQEAHTAAQVSAGRAAADRDRTRDRLAGLEADLRKRKIEAIDQSAAFRTAQGRLAETVLSILRATASAAAAFAEKEARERQAAGLSGRAAADRAARDAARRELDGIRTGWQEQQAAAHARDLAVHDLRARREAVAARLREDYGIDLTQEPADGADPGPALSAAQEIDDLRKKLARLGSVNLEALDELARVEAEHDGLKAQHDDLAAARKSLTDVIDAINGESRALFTNTLTAVRGYFQELFRKLFGGGQADVVLEDGVDVLESGIEITARPPGKELRALSLLSGGERTLTAIALLLAIFRNKPSPFCLLDEVDAALDEANTARLAGVLREFLDRSQFIVITHKKRTMAAADRLWGVTMQESGISRVLPMRFEDWPDEEPAQQAA